MQDVEKIRAAIRRGMAEKSFSQRGLSAAAGMSESGVRDILTKTNSPGINNLKKIAAALDMPIEEITGEEESGAADYWQPRTDTVRTILEIGLLPLTASDVPENDLQLLAHGVTEALKYVSVDPARADSDDFPAAVVATIEAVYRNYTPQHGRVA